MCQQDQRRQIVIQIFLRWRMSDFSDGRAREKVGNRQQKAKISLGNLLGAINTNLGDRRSHQIRVSIRQRDGITVIVIRLNRVRMPLVMNCILMIRSNVMVVVVVEFQNFQQSIMMESPRPDHEGQGGEASHQETVLTSEH